VFGKLNHQYSKSLSCCGPLSQKRLRHSTALLQRVQINKYTDKRSFEGLARRKEALEGPTQAGAQLLAVSVNHCIPAHPRCRQLSNTRVLPSDMRVSASALQSSDAGVVNNNNSNQHQSMVPCGATAYPCTAVATKVYCSALHNPPFMWEHSQQCSSTC
jgi:hypothetical protein